MIKVAHLKKKTSKKQTKISLSVFKELLDEFF